MAPLRHGQVVMRALYSPDGERLLTAGLDGVARIWHATTGDVEVTVTHGTDGRRSRRGLYDAAFSPDGTRFATAGVDGTARIWKTATGQPVGLPLEHGDVVTSVQWSPDGRLVVTASEDRTAVIWDAATGTAVNRNRIEHEGSVEFATFDDRGHAVLTAGGDGVARVWAPDSGHPFASIRPLRHGARLQLARFAPGGRLILTAGDDGSVRLWDASTGVPVGNAVEHAGRVLAAAFDPGGLRLVTASFDGTARIVRPVDDEHLARTLPHELQVTSVAWSPDRTRLATAVLGARMRLWNAKTWKTIADIELAGNADRVVFDPSGRYIATSSNEPATRVWAATTAAPVTDWLRHAKAISSAAFDGSGTRLVTASEDATVKVWTLTQDTSRPLALAHSGPVVTAEFHPERNVLLTAEEAGVIRVWDLDRNPPVVAITATVPGPLKSAGWSAHGHRMLIVPATGNVVWLRAPVPKGADELTVRHANEVTLGRLGAAGTRLVTTSHDGVLSITDVATGRPIRSFAGGYTAAALSTDGQSLATGDIDGILRVWNVATGEPIGRGIPMHASVSDVIFSADGRVLAASAGERVRILELPLLARSPERTRLEAEVSTALTLEPSTGLARLLTESEWMARRRRLNDVAGPVSTPTGR
jgi:WD40 repeat protein